MLVFVSVSLLSFRSGSAPGHLVSLLNFEEAMTQIRNVEEPWYPTQRGGGGGGWGATASTGELAMSAGMALTPIGTARAG
jgi:hypothetical protein